MKRSIAVVLACIGPVTFSSSCDRQSEGSADPTSVAQVQPSAVPILTTRPPVESGTEEIGKSVLGRPIWMRQVGDGPRRVLFIGGIHGDEAEGSVLTTRLPDAFTAAGLAAEVTLFVMEDANPDGREAATRENANGVDINRNFPARNFDPSNPAGGGTPVNQPETRAVVDSIDRIAPQLVIIVHSWANDEFINFDGPSKAIAERFSVASGMKVRTSNDFAPTPGSLGSYIGRDRAIPLLTIEFRKGSDPEKDWLQVHDAVLQAIQGQ